MNQYRISVFVAWFYDDEDHEKDALILNIHWRKYCFKNIGNIFNSEGILFLKDSKLRQ